MDSTHQIFLFNFQFLQFVVKFHILAILFCTEPLSFLLKKKEIRVLSLQKRTKAGIPTVKFFSSNISTTTSQLHSKSWKLHDVCITITNPQKYYQDNHIPISTAFNMTEILRITNTAITRCQIYHVHPSWTIKNKPYIDLVLVPKLQFLFHVCLTIS